LVQRIVITQQESQCTDIGKKGGKQMKDGEPTDDPERGSDEETCAETQRCPWKEVVEIVDNVLCIDNEGDVTEQHHDSE
jgi:hypothetical protein